MLNRGCELQRLNSNASVTQPPHVSYLLPCLIPWTCWILLISLSRDVSFPSLFFFFVGAMLTKNSASLDVETDPKHFLCLRGNSRDLTDWAICSVTQEEKKESKQSPKLNHVVGTRKELGDVVVSQSISSGKFRDSGPGFLSDGDIYLWWKNHVAWLASGL